MNVNNRNVDKDLQAIQQEQQIQHRKKCHGNRSDQRFRRHCRKQNMSEAIIAQLVEQRRNSRRIDRTNRIINNAITPDQHTRSISTDHNRIKTTAAIVETYNKRKQDVIPTETTYNIPKSLSRLSFSQTSNKKIKRKIEKKKRKKKSKKSRKTAKWRRRIQNTANKELYRQQPAYLKISWHILIQTLAKHLKHPLKKRSEQKFIYIRIFLLDEEYGLDRNQYLLQSYLNIGSQQSQQTDPIWPSDIYEKIKSTESIRCEHYIIEALNDAETNLERCHSKLNVQAQTWVSTLPPLDMLDDSLKQFVRRQNRNLSTKIETQLEHYKCIIEEQQSFQEILSYLTPNDKIFVDELLTLQQKQLQLMEELVKLEQRILCNVLPPQLNCVDRLIPYHIYRPLFHDIGAIEFNNQSTRIIQRLKREWLSIYYKAYETQIQQHEEQYIEHLHKLQLQFRGRANINQVCALNSIKTYLKQRKERLVQQIYASVSDCRRKLLNDQKHTSKRKHAIGVSPQPVFYLLHNPFNKRERDYLARGPNYIRINQSAVQSYKQRKQIIHREHKKLLHKLQTYLSSHYRIRPTLPIYKIYSENLQRQLDLRYMAPLSLNDRLRAQQEKDLVKSICYKLKKHKLLVRVTDKSGVFCVLRYKDHEQKAMEYREKTNAYKELSLNPFQDTVKKVVRLLNDLHAKHHKLRAWQYRRMQRHIKASKLAYMYFNPKTHKDGTPFRPIMNTIKSPTSGISRLLDQLIRPIFNENAAATNIVDGAHLIKRLHYYAIDGHLNSNTLFCTFDINNLYTMLPQEESLNIIVEFLQTCNKHHVQGIDIPTLRELARIVIEENVFVYDNKYYQQIIGGAMGTPFTLTLANIFMWKWERQSICKELPSTEIYGRYIDDVFFTWNDTQAKLEQLLERLNFHHPNIKLEYKIGQSLPFLDVLFTNTNGILSTSVYRKPSSEPYVVPYSSDHPPHIFKTIIRAALLRALRYSSTFEAFNTERRNIRLKLLYNGYPTRYLNKEFRKFLIRHNTYDAYSSILPIITRERDFTNIRETLMPLPTRRQKAVEGEIAISQDEYHSNEIRHEQIPPEPVPRRDKKQFSLKQPLFQHYIYEKRLTCLKRNIRTTYRNTFSNTTLQETKVIIGHRNNPKLKDFILKRKRPRAKLRRSSQR